MPLHRTAGLGWLFQRDRAPGEIAVAEIAAAPSPCARDIVPAPFGDRVDATAAEPSGEDRRASTRQSSALRAVAQAAYIEVVGGGPRALDAALGVLEADATMLRERLAAQEEALKLLGLYASDAWARSVAAKALAAPCRGYSAALPAFLYDADLAATGACGCEADR
jgi:hypothetical protein